MKILYDHQIFSEQNYGGISRYFTELMNYYYKTKIVEFELSLKYSDNLYLKEVPYSQHKEFFLKVPFKGKGTIRNIINNSKSRTIISKSNFDVFHPTYYNPYFLNLLKAKPFIITVYDLTHEIYSNDLGDSKVLIKQKEQLIKKSAKIIAISNNTKQDLLKYYDVNEEKISVVYLANPLKSKIILHNLYLPEKFVLFVGNRGAYKNFSNFIQGMTTILANDDELTIVCGGGGKFSKNEIKEFKRLHIGERIKYYNIDDTILFNLYKKAQLFVFPSLYEGFGLPVLESFYSGCCLVASNRTSIPEVAENAAIYFDPENPDDIACNIEKVLYNKNLRQSLIIKGYEQLKKYSWKKTAESTARVYSEITC